MPLTTEQIAQVRSALIAATERAGQSCGLRGAEAGVAVLNAIPGVGDLRVKEHGYGSLREFITREVPELKVIGNSGKDVIYGLEQWSPLAEPPGSSVGPEATELWRIWVSPASPQHLAVERETGKVRVVSPGEQPYEGEVKIAPLPMEAHKRIAADYLTTAALSTPLRESLERAFASSFPDWWKEWNAALKGTPELHAWLKYRQSALENALREALGDVGLSEEAVQAAFGSTMASRQRARTMLTHGAPVEHHIEHGDVSAPSPHAELIRLVLAIAPRLSEDELRSLRLPLGLVLDILGELRRSGIY